MIIKVEKQQKECITLDKLKIGKKAIVKKVGGKGLLRVRLLDMGIIPNTEIKIIKKAPMGDPLQLFLRGYELTIREDDAKKIEIEEVCE